MRPSRSFRPSLPVALEDRVVPSSLTGNVTTALAQLVSQVRKHGISVQRVGLSAVQLAQSNASDNSFAAPKQETLQSGIPVAERKTIIYATGTPQTESILEVPNLSNNTLTTYKTINLRNGGGTETVVDTESFSGGTIPLAGTNNTHTITTTDPDGFVQTETENEVITGNKTVANATIHEASGTQTWTSVSIKRGPITTENKTITEPNGRIEHQKTVTTHRGLFDATAMERTVSPGEILLSPTATDVMRVQPPSS